MFTFLGKFDLSDGFYCYTRRIKKKWRWPHRAKKFRWSFLAPAGILGEPFYKILQIFGPCGHIRVTLLQNILFENYLSPSSLTRKFLICFRKTYFTLQFLNIFVSEITWWISYLWNFLTWKPPVFTHSSLFVVPISFWDMKAEAFASKKRLSMAPSLQNDYFI